MRDWDELVTTALLGTDRRPVLTTAALLDEAARHRATRRAIPPLVCCPAPPRSPRPDRPDAPVAAQELLDGLLAQAVPELVNAWLAAAVEAQVVLATRHWARIGALAATRAGYDRQLLALALGAPGRWYLDQNPAWTRLAQSVRGALPTSAFRSATGGGPDGCNQQEPTEVLSQAEVPSEAAVPSEAEVLARPEAALAVAAPWPRPLTVAAVRAVSSGRLGWRAAAYGSAVGARMAVADVDVLLPATDGPMPGGDRGAAWAVRLIQDALGAATRAVEVRRSIAGVFAPTSPAPAPASPTPSGTP